jgi:hypothetical protein
VFAGATNLTVAFPFPGAAVPIVGAPGTVPAVTLFDAADAALVPALLVAVMVNVYGVPFVSPLTVMGLEEPVPVRPPGFEVTV